MGVFIAPRAAVLFLAAAGLLSAGCAPSPYQEYCAQLKGAEREACLTDPAAREAYAREQARESAADQFAFVSSYPADIIAPTDRLRREARRVAAVSEVPNIGMIPSDDRPELVGQVFVVRTSFYAFGDENGLGAGVALGTLDAPEDLASGQAHYLSRAQLEYLEALCIPLVSPCEGDVYLRLARTAGIDWIEPQVVAIDLPPVTIDVLFEQHLAFYLGWLAHLDEAAAH